MSEYNFRRVSYKNDDKDFESQRKNRNDYSVEIRKAKKEEQLQKRRNIIIDDLSEMPEKLNRTPVAKLSVHDILVQLNSYNIEKMIEAATSCRIQLSKSENAPIEMFYGNDVIPVLVKTLTSFNDDTLIFETSWALTNIASGESKFTQAVVEAGAVPIFMTLMSHESDMIAEQSVWALSNIVGDCAAYRDAIIQYGIIPAVEQAIVRFWNKPEAYRQVCWLVSNLFRHKGPAYPKQAVFDMLPLLREMMTTINDPTANTDLCWALTYACDGRGDIINAIIECDLLSVLIVNLSGPSQLQTPSLRALGTVVAGTDEQVDAAIAAGVINSLRSLVTNSQARIVKEACWLISNISAGTDAQVTALVEGGVIVDVLKVIMTGDYKSQREASWVIANMVGSETDGHKFYLLNNNVFESIVPMLSCDDLPLVLMLLDSVRDLLQCTDNVGQLEGCIEMFEKCGGLDVIEKLQNHESADVYLKSFEIVKKYFGGDGEEDMDNCEQVHSVGVDKFKF